MAMITTTRARTPAAMATTNHDHKVGPSTSTQGRHITRVIEYTHLDTFHIKGARLR